MTSPVIRRALLAVIAALGAVAVGGLVILWPDAERPALGPELGFGAQLVDAVITETELLPCAGTAPADRIYCEDVRFRVTSGPTKGDRGTFQNTVTDTSLTFARGDGIVVGYQADAEPAFQYYFNDFQRKTPMTALVVVFIVAVLALGRWQGLRALLGLVVTGIVMVGFLFPSILDGNNPTAVALVSAVVIALVALYLTHGITDMTTVALLGTFAALALTAVLAAVFTNAARFTGFSSEDAFFLTVASNQVDIRGLILAGIIIGSLGVLDDVTVTQVSAVWQLHKANPSFGARRLYRAGLVIGRDHIASTVNTLVLAYAGASLPLLLLFTQAGRRLTDVAVGELVGVEVVRTLVGSIGLVAAVPITTALAAIVVTRGRAPEASAQNEPGSATSRE